MLIRVIMGSNKVDGVDQHTLRFSWREVYCRNRYTRSSTHEHVVVHMSTNNWRKSQLSI